MCCISTNVPDLAKVRQEPEKRSTGGQAKLAVTTAHACQLHRSLVGSNAASLVKYCGNKNMPYTMMACSV
jgi:hypothetical protein